MMSGPQMLKANLSAFVESKGSAARINVARTTSLPNQNCAAACSKSLFSTVSTQCRHASSGQSRSRHLSRDPIPGPIHEMRHHLICKHAHRRFGVFGKQSSKIDLQRGHFESANSVAVLGDCLPDVLRRTNPGGPLFHT